MPLITESTGLRLCFKRIHLRRVIGLLLMLWANTYVDDTVAASLKQSADAESEPSSASSLTNSLAAYWTLNETSGTRFDSVGTSHLSPRNDPGSGPGKTEYGAYFNGNGQGLCTPSNSALEMGTVDYTLAAWVYLNGPIWNGYMLMAKDELGTARDYVVEYQNLDSANAYDFVVLNSASDGPTPGSYGVVAQPSPGFQQWTFVAARHHAAINKVSLKINGSVPVYGDVPIVPGVSSAAFCLGMRNAFDLVALNGRMDEVGIWKRALTDSELELLYNNGQGLTYPFAVNALSGSTKTASSAIGALALPVTYTIALVNANVITPTSTRLTDTLPSSLSYVPDSLTATAGTAAYNSGAIYWSGTVTPTLPVTITYAAVINANNPLGITITNTAYINAEESLLARTAAVQVPLGKVYLPLLFRPAPGIQGKITQNGSPAPGTFLELRFFNGANWSTWATTYTNNDGTYAFATAPTLAPDQRLYVRYRNTAQTPGRLWLWATRELTTYTAGAAVNIGNFDLADVALIAPPDYASVNLPYFFQWVTRWATTTDSYALEIYDITGGSSYAATNSLGYTGGITVLSLPSGFNTGTPYGWDVLVFSPDGGLGVAYETRVVTFNNSGLGLASPQVAESQWTRFEPREDLPSR